MHGRSIPASPKPSLGSSSLRSGPSAPSSVETSATAGGLMTGSLAPGPIAPSVISAAGFLYGRQLQHRYLHRRNRLSQSFVDDSKPHHDDGPRYAHSGKAISMASAASTRSSTRSGMRLARIQGS